MFLRHQTISVLICSIVGSLLRNGLATQTLDCGSVLEADTGELKIQPSKSSCFYIIKLQRTTGISLQLEEFTTEPITVIPSQKYSQANFQSSWMVGPEATYTFEGKIFVILASPRNQKASVNWRGMTVDSSDVTLNTKFERSLEGTLDWEQKKENDDTIIWAVEPQGTGELNWEMTSDVSPCGQDNACECISLGVIHVTPGGRISKIHKSCEDSSVGSWKVEKNSLVVLMFTESTTPEVSKLQVTWKCEPEVLKREVTGIAVATEGGLYVVDLNPSKTIQVSSKPVGGVAFDWNSEKIYWAEKGVGIMRANLDGSDFEQLIADQLISGVGIESITGNLYYVSQSRSSLRVCNNDGKKCSSIVSLSGTIWDVAFHSSKGLLFWSDTKTGVFQAKLDGSNVKHIADYSSYGIDVDESKDRLYTHDQYNEKIISYDYDLNGVNRRASKEGYLKAIDFQTDGDIIFYSSNWFGYSLRSKANGDVRSTVIANFASHPGSVALFGERFSPARSNPCEKVKCAHLCVRITASSYRCLCPGRKKLQEDGISCSI